MVGGRRGEVLIKPLRAAHRHNNNMRGLLEVHHWTCFSGAKQRNLPQSSFQILGREVAARAAAWQYSPSPWHLYWRAQRQLRHLTHRGPLTGQKRWQLLGASPARRYGCTAHHRPSLDGRGTAVSGSSVSLLDAHWCVVTPPLANDAPWRRPHAHLPQCMAWHGSQHATHRAAAATGSVGTSGLPSRPCGAAPCPGRACC